MKVLTFFSDISISLPNSIIQKLYKRTSTTTMPRPNVGINDIQKFSVFWVIRQREVV